MTNKWITASVSVKICFRIITTYTPFILLAFKVNFGDSWVSDYNANLDLNQYTNPLEDHCLVNLIDEFVLTEISKHIILIRKCGYVYILSWVNETKLVRRVNLDLVVCHLLNNTDNKIDGSQGLAEYWKYDYWVNKDVPEKSIYALIYYR